MYFVRKHTSETMSVTARGKRLADDARGARFSQSVVHLRGGRKHGVVL